LEEQVRHRLIGCGFEYNFLTSLLSGVANRVYKLKKMLLKMMKAENTDAGKKKYKQPLMPNVKNIFKFNVPILGRETQLRSRINKTIQMKSEDLVQLVDDEDCLAHREEFMDAVFYDDDEDETRMVTDVVFGEDVGWQVVSRMCHRDGTLKIQKRQEEYIIGDGLRQMLQWHQDNLVNDEIAKLAKKRKAQERDKKKSKKRKKKTKNTTKTSKKVKN